MDLYNSHARYNHASIKEIKKAIRDAFNVENKYLHESLKKKIDEDFDVNHPIGVLPHADAVATEQHIADRAAGLERRANPDKDPLVKELIEETASEESRTLHYDVVDRKGLAKILTEAKKNKQKFKVGKSDKLGYRYFVDIFPIYGSQGALDVIEDGAEGDEVDGGEMLGESLNKGEACFTKQDGVPGYLVNDEGKEKFLRNYTEKQVKDLGFEIKKDLKEDYDRDDILEIARALGKAHDGLVEASELLSYLDADVLSDELRYAVEDLEAEASELDFMGEDNPVEALLAAYGGDKDDEVKKITEELNKFSNKNGIRLVIDLCIDTINRRPKTLGGVRKGLLVKYFDTKGALRDYLIETSGWYEDYMDFKEDSKFDIDYTDGKDHTDEEIELLLMTFEDPGDGTPNVQYIGIDGKPAFKDYWNTYYTLDNKKLLKNGTQEEIQDKYLSDDEEEDYDLYEQKESLKEKKYKTPMNETEDYINAMYKAYEALKNRKNAYAAVYGYRKDKKFIPLLSIKDSQAELTKVVDGLKTREKGQTDVIVYTLFKNNLDGAEDTLKSKGLLKESLKEDYDDFDYYKEQLDALDLDDTSYDYYLGALYEVADEDPYAGYKSFAAVLKDARSTAEQGTEDGDGDDILKEDLQVYTSTLKDFKPAKEAEPLWNEIIEKGKLDDLEYELENVFKADDDENASIDIEGLNDLLVNHQDFIRTLIGLDDTPLEDDDYDEKPVGENEMVYYEDDEEPVDEDASIEADEDDIDVDEIEGIDEDDEDDIEPIYGDEEERKTPTKWKKIESDEDDNSEEEEPKDKTDKSETEEDKKEKKEEKVEESLDKKEPEIKIDDEEEDLEECDKDLKECGPSKDDDLTESIAKGFVKSNFTEAKDMSGMSDEEKRQELARKSLASLNESDEEVIEIDDKELTEALGMPTEDQVKKEESKVEQPKPEEVKEEPKENKNEEIK